MRSQWLSSVSLFAVVLATSVVCVDFQSAAQAADLSFEPVEPAPIAAPLFSWAGFYAGVHGGYVTGDHDETGVPETPGSTVPTTQPTEPTRLMPGASLVGPAQILSQLSTGGSFNGGIVGVHAGYNFQFDRFILGFEGDIDYSGAKADGVTNALGYEVSNSFETDWQGSLRARAGYAVDRVLFYGTGGVAFGRGELTIADGFSSGSDSNVHTGWTAGAGIEYAFTNNWLGRLEARYTDFGSKTYDFGNAGKVDVDWDQTSILLGLGYKF